MKFLLGIDNFVLSCVAWCLGFCEANFSWTQKWIERVLIVMIGILGMLTIHEYYTYQISGLLFLVWFLWRAHKKPAVYRLTIERSVFSRSMRILYIILCGIDLSAIGVINFHFRSLMFTLTMTLMFYMLAIPWDDDGQRKRHKKLSLAKAIGLFGTSWIEQPLGVH